MDTDIERHPKVRVAYFTWSGHCRQLAEKAAKETGGVLFPIETMHRYSSIYGLCIAQGGLEYMKKSRPQLKAYMEDGDFDTLVLIHPIWCGTAPMAIFSFLDHLPLHGKRIILITSGKITSGDKSEKDIWKQYPEADVAAVLSLKEKELESTGIEERLYAFLKEEV